MPFLSGNAVGVTMRRKGLIQPVWAFDHQEPELLDCCHVYPCCLAHLRIIIVAIMSSSMMFIIVVVIIPVNMCVIIVVLMFMTDPTLPSTQPSSKALEQGLTVAPNVFFVAETSTTTGQSPDPMWVQDNNSPTITNTVIQLSPNLNIQGACNELISTIIFWPILALNLQIIIPCAVLFSI